MDLCVGATSRLVVEEAARLKVPQIIASRRQVNAAGGYTGMTQPELTQVVAELSGGATAVIRDHGGPFQGGDPSDLHWEDELDADVAAGFSGLHLDVSAVPRADQVALLQRLAGKYGSAGGVAIQVGGERDSQAWLYVMLAAALEAGVRPTHCVAALGGHAFGDRQCGEMISPQEARHITNSYHALGVSSVAHNMDFCDRGKYASSVDAVNVAPELGVIETDAWLRAVPPAAAGELLRLGHESQRWLRWFPGAAGTRLERARCGLRYIWAALLPDLRQRDWYPLAEEYVRQEVRDAISAG